MEPVVLARPSLAKCIRCHRTLTNPTSVYRGLGPVCAAKAGIISRRDRVGDRDHYYPYARPVAPDTFRDLAGVADYTGFGYAGWTQPFNDPAIGGGQRVAVRFASIEGQIIHMEYLDPRLDLERHSPTGFNWGYGGSGPAQLALAIMWDYLERNRPGEAPEFMARMAYQDLKASIVAGLDDEWVLLEERMTDWYYDYTGR